jgi:hypothetical protein
MFTKVNRRTARAVTLIPELSVICNRSGHCCPKPAVPIRENEGTTFYNNVKPEKAPWYTCASSVFASVLRRTAHQPAVLCLALLVSSCSPAPVDMWESSTVTESGQINSGRVLDPRIFSFSSAHTFGDPGLRWQQEEQRRADELWRRREQERLANERRRANELRRQQEEQRTMPVPLFLEH